MAKAMGTDPRVYVIPHRVSQLMLDEVGPEAQYFILPTKRTPGCSNLNTDIAPDRLIVHYMNTQ